MRVSVLLLALFGALALVNGGLLTTRNFAPEGWNKLSAASPHSEVEFTVGLYNRNLDVLEQKFWEVSDPQHENYQNFMSIEEINALVAPPKADHDKVVDWLIKHGVQERKIKSFTDAMDVKTTVAVASRLFQTSFHVFEHVTEKTTTISAWGEMSLPDNIHKYVKIVTGISTFPIPHLRVHRSRTNTGADRKLLQGDTQGIVAQSLTTLYSLPVEHFGTAMKTSQGVIEFQGQNYAPTDLSSYGQQVNLNIETLANNHIIGPNDPTNPQIEPTLDIEMIATVNREADNWFWLETGNGWLYQFGNHFFNTATVPMISSISYGWWEGDQCSISSNCGALGINSTQYTEAVNVLFQKIALRGISLLASSGDSGANGRTDPDCTIPQLRAAFPASSPYITAVGATQLNHPVYNLPGVASIPICNGNGYTCASNGDEVAVSYAISQFASGGGFSNIAAQPSYQKAAVAAYWNSGVPMPPASYFNKTGRGFPDIAALGHNGLIYTGGAAQAVGGTSMSAPISAAIFSLLNQAQMKNTGKPLGFLNPLIYQAFAADPTNFNDITVGDNICTEDGCSSGCTGFTAAKGWDPVTGVGSPNYAKLLAYINAQTELRQKKKVTLAQA